MKNTPSLPSPPLRSTGFLWVLAFSGLALLLGSFAYFQVRQAQTSSHSLLDYYGKAPEFQLINQDGKEIALQNLKGVTWVVDFIFTRCQGPCPLLTARLAQLGEKLKGDNHVKLISVTVDPEYDNPEVLKEYAKKFQANTEQWNFLTGTKDQIESFIVKGMLQSIIRNAPSGPIHSTQIVVVDSQGQIRAFRDGTDPHVVTQLMSDINSLKRESATHR